ncbi:hypothetical protein CFK37_15230 [Virgibacillus phasianinus]|uniref:Gamma-glutamylcyclotransferase family protein n=1 Tax=Virgibacillus phasianinus TaxID=2017483 RepID=A0A220U6R6_9BACI|nr:gamma-glutamylcyclotransferase family protein [Virgibacillus phasianinus]ASK63413.1 hypothetical protein CFK37_15230 [Virgibacillus phasianinus]
MTKLFVYGTLREDNRNHFYLKRVTVIWKQCWVTGSLYDTGNGYPVLLRKKENQPVYGELYDVSNEQLNKIDALEGYDETRQHNLYNREYITVVHHNGDKTRALVYYGGESLIDSADHIESGDWNVHAYLRENNIL